MLLLPLLAAVVVARCAPSVAAADLSEAVSGNTFTRQGDYVIAPNDQISVKVFGQEQLTGVFTVSPSGIVSYPLVGYVTAAGLTSVQLTDRLGKALKPYVKSPIVTVVVTNRDSFQVFFSGELNKPGAVVMQNRTTLLQGLAVAGGLTRFASGRIVLLRQTATGATKRYATTYHKLLGGQQNLDRFTLERGDVVHAE